MAVDRNRAALRFVKAQEQVDDGGFARAAAADQADFFAGFDVQIKAVEERFACFVGEIDVIKLDFASGDFKRQGLRFVEDGVGFGQGSHAVVDGTDVFKQSGGFPHDVLRQTVHTQCHGRGGGYRAYADLAVIPKPNTQGVVPTVSELLTIKLQVCSSVAKRIWAWTVTINSSIDCLA